MEPSLLKAGVPGMELKLGDARALAFAEFGDPSGLPVYYFEWPTRY